MLIVEGPDCVGKSVFCRSVRDEIIKRLHKRRIYRTVTSDHCEKPRDDQPHNLSWQLRDLHMWHVRDRQHISELVYGSTCRGKVELSVNDLDVLDHTLENCFGAVVVVIHADEFTYRKFLDIHHSSESEDFDKHQCIEVAKKYHKICGFKPMLLCNQRFYAPKIHRNYKLMLHPKGDYPEYVSKAFVNEIAEFYIRRQLHTEEKEINAATTL